MRSFFCFPIFLCRLCRNSFIAFTTHKHEFLFSNRQNKKLTEKLFHKLWKYIAIRKLSPFLPCFLNFLSLEYCIFSSLHIFLGVWAVLLPMWNLSRVTLHWHLRIYMLEMSSSDTYCFDLCWKLYSLLFVQRNCNSLLEKSVISWASWLQYSRV